MRRPIIAAMSGVSVAVLGLSLHASERTAPAAGRAVQAGLVGSPGGAGADSAPTAATGTIATPTPPRSSATRRPALRPIRGAASSRPPTAAPARASHAPAPSPTARRTAPSPAARPSAKPAPPTVVVDGSPADTQYGPVQVQVTLRGGHIIRSDAIAYPRSGGRDQEINSRAVPQLDDETVQADGAQIDTVSGATYTSDGYRQSLQSALDAAHKAGAR